MFGFHESAVVEKLSYARANLLTGDGYHLINSRCDQGQTVSTSVGVDASTRLS